MIAPGGENQVRKCACKCNGHLKYPQGITNAESCKAINGQSCVDGDDIFKYTDCSWAWTDAWIVLRP